MGPPLWIVGCVLLLEGLSSCEHRLWAWFYDICRPEEFLFRFLHAMVSFPRSSTCLPHCPLSFAPYGPIFCTLTAIAQSQAILVVYDCGTAENLWQLLLSFSKERFRIMWLGSERIRQRKVPSAIYWAFAKVVLGYVSRQVFAIRGCLGLRIKTARNASTSGTALYQLPCYGARWVQVVTVLEMESSWKFNHENLHKAAPKSYISDVELLSCAVWLVPLWEEWYLNTDSSMQAHHVQAHLKHLDI